MEQLKDECSNSKKLPGLDVESNLEKKSALNVHYF
jgi:hypothetical protein